MAKQISISPEEQFARDYADRLILEQISELQSVIKLSEIADKLGKDGIGLAAVRSLLASNPNRFGYAERRWVPASRIEGAGRPLAEQIRLTVERFGGPMPISLVINELHLTAPNATEDTIDRLLQGTDLVCRIPGDKLILREWCFFASDQKLDEALSINGVDHNDFDFFTKKLEGVDWRSKGVLAKVLKEHAPIPVKLVGAVAWSILNPQDPRALLHYDWREFNRELFSADGFVYGADGKIYPESETKKWISSAIRLADKIAPNVEIEDAQPIEVKDEDVDRMVKKIMNSESSVTATRILEEFYEITPSVRTFPDDIRNVIDALKARSEVLWVGGDRFNKPDVVPDLVKSTPEIFEFQQTAFVDEEGELVDVELTDDGLSSTLRKLLNHPLATDVIDEDIVPAAKQVQDSVRCVLKSIHRELGTFPLSQVPTGWLSEDPNYQEFIFIDKEGRELQVWVNTDSRLMFNLIDWFYEQPVESGAVFSLTKTNRPNVIEFEWLDQTDPVVFITAQRMEELRDLQMRSDDMSTYDILREVMSHWPKGADFLTLLWEINVVRRTSRRMVASLLSSYACFYQRSGSPVWHYDQKKVDQGFDKSKRKFIKK